jgi:hypothetical protein
MKDEFFYLSFIDENYPYACKVCANCGRDIPYNKKGTGYMFCNLDCASKYWNEVEKFIVDFV